MKRAKSKKPEVEPIVVDKINITSVNRTFHDIDHFKRSLIGAESPAIRNRTNLYDLYENALLDGFVSGVIEKRIDAVCNKELKYFDSKRKKVFEFDRLINSKEFTRLLTKIMEAKLFGITGLEFLPGKTFKFKEISRKHIKPHKQIISFDQDSDEDGISYKNLENVWIIGDPKDLGILLHVVPYAIYKRGTMADWAQFIEIFGQPIRIIKYDIYDDKTRKELRSILDNSGSSLAMMIPKQAEFDIMDGKESNADGELFAKFVRILNEEIAVIILGATETTMSSKSSGLAQAEVHAGEQNNKAKSDLLDVCSTLNSGRFQRILRSYGFPSSDGGYFEFENALDLNYLRNRVDIDCELSKSIPISDNYWYETYGIPKPLNYDELKTKMVTAKGR